MSQVELISLGTGYMWDIWPRIVYLRKQTGQRQVGFEPTNSRFAAQSSNHCNIGMSTSTEWPEYTSNYRPFYNNT